MLNMDFKKRHVLETASMEWLAGPSPTVLKKLLERDEQESGHETSIIQYTTGTDFKTDPHPLGEEILVLEGVFSDETGDFGPGSYLRNPPGSSHAPRSKEGCVIMVKQNQFDSEDLASVRIDTRTEAWRQGIGGLQVMPLYEFKGEHVALVKWPAGEVFQPHSHFGGEEIFVLSGIFRDEHGTYPARTWIRSPHLSEHYPYVEEETLIWVKTGHLPIEV